MKLSIALAPEHAVAHLNPGIWQQVNRLHLRKILAEFAHERIINPELIRQEDDWNYYRLSSRDGHTVYDFKARMLALNHWYIDTASINRLYQGEAAAPDAMAFVSAFREEMGIAESMLPVYMEEVSSTLCGAAYMQHYGKPTVNSLLEADYQQIEGTMTGHPRFIANNGRIGFDAEDYRRYAPETAQPFPLVWLAGHKGEAIFSGISTLSYEQVILQELDEETQTDFKAQLEAKGLRPEDYLLLPVHPWQWFNKLSNIFAPDIARNRLVCLGYSKDNYLPQQSIRTFYNTSQPDRFYVKTALAILNMGYVRGLSPYFMKTNPGINEWLHDLIVDDTYLQQKGFCILREVASVSYGHRLFNAAIPEDSPYKKMLACLWRESPGRKLKPGQKLMTMAALLHIDNDGAALLPELIQASGLDTASWLKRYLDSYFSPLLHCFYKWDLVFMPHGENLILVMEDHVPVRAIMKDIGEEISLLNPDMEVPEVARRLMVPVTDEARTLPLFTQVFDSILRFISAILVEHTGFPETVFWSLVADCIHDYQQSHPEYKTAYERFNLFVPHIRPDALNKLQLNNNRQLRNRANPFMDLATVGILDNPVAPFKNQPVNL
ncbi:IucA/IucC family protein [Taibaiella koreensis]|uniref:IucA/IucC family protein n=1 Tax=Taibaiella koreensis TaxID=1268548 RepID=UPI000E59F724|nr:IucA/IucC family siderophore biosynthesis protein [Taibaiella koreensis]